MIAACDALERLLRGDRLVHNLALATWSLAWTGDTLRHHIAHDLLREPLVALSPAMDCLPGFPANWSQSWSSTAPAERRSRAAALAEWWDCWGSGGARLLEALLAAAGTLDQLQLAELLGIDPIDVCNLARPLIKAGLIGGKLGGPLTLLPRAVEA